MPPPDPPTIVIRHHKENIAKCSLRTFVRRPDAAAISYPRCVERLAPRSFAGRILLTLDAPPLTPRDADTGLLVIDATWRYASRMLRSLRPALDGTIARSIPVGFVTAYPRCQTACPDPAAGLASIEAVYLAYVLLRRDTSAVLDNYRWADRFRELNADRLAALL